MSTITETCPCGSSFTLDDPTEIWTTAAFIESLTAWRQEHRHSRSVGPCTDTIGSALTGRSFCGLDAGHIGAHHDSDSGQSWWQDDPVNPTLSWATERTKR